MEEQIREKENKQKLKTLQTQFINIRLGAYNSLCELSVKTLKSILYFGQFYRKIQLVTMQTKALNLNSNVQHFLTRTKTQNKRN